MTDRRLFFALWPDPPVQTVLHERQEQLLGDTPGRLTAMAQLHLTLVFLGRVPAALCERLQQGKVPPLGEFELQLDTVGYWRKPQIFWLGSRRRSDPLMALVAELRRQCMALGLEVDQRDFVPHITMARRVRKPPPVRRFDPVIWPVRHCSLVASQFVPDGVNYRELARWPLGPSLP